MNIDEWEIWYERILNDFNFSRKGDEETASILNKILEDENSLSLEELNEKINDKKKSHDFIVFGAGPSLKKDIKRIHDKINNYVLVAADGATTALLEENIIPDIIVTDLDGKITDLLTANENGSLFIVHAHGDNREAIEKYVSVLDNVLGTTQSNPYGKLYNFGGFTDGDRAIFLTLALNPNEILLAGMDFGEYVTQYSRPKIKNKVEEADDIKKRKLKYAEELVEWIKNNETVPVKKIDED